MGDAGRGPRPVSLSPRYHPASPRVGCPTRETLASPLDHLEAPLSGASHVGQLESQPARHGVAMATQLSWPCLASGYLHACPQVPQVWSGSVGLLRVHVLPGASGGPLTRPEHLPTLLLGLEGHPQSPALQGVPWFPRLGTRWAGLSSRHPRASRFQPAPADMPPPPESVSL